MKASVKTHGRSHGLHRSGSSLATPISDLASGTKLFIKSHSTAEIGLDKAKDKKREQQMREMVRHFAQPKKPQLLSPRDKRRKQVDAIYEYLRSHGMPEIPFDITSSLEDFVNENKRYLAWMPTEPRYFVVCEPIVEATTNPVLIPSATSGSGSAPSTPTRDHRQMTISMNSPMSKFDFGEDLFDPTMASLGSSDGTFLSSIGKPQGFLSAIEEDEPQGFLSLIGDLNLKSHPISTW